MAAGMRTLSPSGSTFCAAPRRSCRPFLRVPAIRTCSDPRAIVVLDHVAVHTPKTVAGSPGMSDRSGGQLHLDPTVRRSGGVDPRCERERERYCDHYQELWP